MRMPSRSCSSRPRRTGSCRPCYGLTGGLLLSARSSRASRSSATRAAEALHIDRSRAVARDRPRIRHARARSAKQLTDDTRGGRGEPRRLPHRATARPRGHPREVIGDRLLIVDAIQGFGVVDAAWDAADVVLRQRLQVAARRPRHRLRMVLSSVRSSALTPVLSGFAGTEEDEPWWTRAPARAPTQAFTGCRARPVADGPPRERAARRSPTSAWRRIDASCRRASRAVDRSSPTATTLAVVSSRDEQERAGIVALGPRAAGGHACSPRRCTTTG